MDHRPEGVPRDQRRDGLLRLHDVARAQAARPDAAPVRPEPRRPQGAARADRRPLEADPQGGVRAVRGQGAALHHRSGRLDVHGAARIQRPAVGRGLDRQRALHQRHGREPADLADPDLRARLDRHLRLHHRRVGVGVEVLDPRLDAHVRTARLVRGVTRAERARRRADGAVAQPDRHRRQATSRRCGSSSHS